MMASTIIPTASAIMSVFLIEEFGLSIAQYSALVALPAAAGVCAAPFGGILVDKGYLRLGISAVFGSAGASAGVYAVAQTYAHVVVAATIAGIAMAFGNIATNQAIASGISRKLRGLAIGVKQTGSYLGITAAGLTLPILAKVWSWRIGFALISVVGVTLGVIAPLWLRSRAFDKDRPSRPQGATKWKAPIAALAGITMVISAILSVVLSFWPLYVQERAEYGIQFTGLLVALLGGVAVFARPLWGLAIDRRGKQGLFLRVATLLATISTIGLWRLPALGPWAGVAAVILAGSTLMAWHAIGWTVLVNIAGRERAGTATGLMVMANLVGFSVGPVLYGALLTSAGSYSVAWATILLMIGMAYIGSIIGDHKRLWCPATGP